MFPLLSVTLYVIVYSPIFDVSTVPSIFMFFVKSPSLSSLAFAPCSLYSFPTTIAIFGVPFSVIVGGLSSTRFTVLFLTLVFPEESETVYIISNVFSSLL